MSHPAIYYDVNLHLLGDSEDDLPPAPTTGWHKKLLIVDPGDGCPERIADYAVMVFDPDDTDASSPLIRLAPLRIELATDHIVITGHLVGPQPDGSYAATEARAFIVASPSAPVGGGSAT
jgi:hypothetical protein